MHLLFIGIDKDISVTIKDWISKNKRSSIYKTITVKVYETVPSIKFDWLKLIDQELLILFFYWNSSQTLTYQQQRSEQHA